MIRIRRDHWLVWLIGLAATTVGLLLVRGQLDKAHVALLYLLLVLAGSVAGGRRLGLALAGLAFLSFNWFFLPPYNALVIADPFDWLVLLTFLIVAGVAAEIVHRLRLEAEDARRRTEEVDRLASLGAESLAHPDADGALAAIAETIRSTLSLRVCLIHRLPANAVATDLVRWVSENRRAAAKLADGTTRLADSSKPTELVADAVALWLPLTAADRVVGVLELQSDHPIGLDDNRRRFLAALGYYAALGVERVRLEAETAGVAALKEADRLKDAVLASVSHDLRTPLTTIKALATELAAEGQDRAVTITEEADRLNRLVADLLDLSRLRAGGFPIRLEVNAVDELVGAALQRLSGAIGDREVKVRMEQGGTLLVGRFDLGQSIRILVNLIENAHKYSPPGTAIDLQVATDATELVFTVMDRGPGIDEHQRERVFEPFYRPPDRVPDSGGVGLGLPIARWLAEAQGGTLAYLPRPGGGSCFVLRLAGAVLDPEPESL